MFENARNSDIYKPQFLTNETQRRKKDKKNNKKIMLL